MRNNTAILDHFQQNNDEQGVTLAQRLINLCKRQSQAQIAVFGKYNHGKSSLLNALVEKNVFKVSDKRETRKIAKYQANNICWLDTPGLDADIFGLDDQTAKTATLQQADHVLLVHSIVNGELDEAEEKTFSRLLKQTPSKFTLVLSQIDGMEMQQVDKIAAKIQARFPQVPTFKVSARAFSEGIKSGNKILIEKSGIKQLQKACNALADKVENLREEEKGQVVARIQKRLQEHLQKLQSEKRQIQAEKQQLTENFEADLDSLLDSVETVY